MGLTIGVATVLALLGLVGLFRGVRRGVVALAGTLLGAVLVDLWQERWADWLRGSFRPEQPALPTFMLTATVFISVALLIGYGGSMLLPKPPTNARAGGLLNSLLGGLVGALNGALIVSYLLRYAGDLWSGEEVAGLLAGSLIAEVLDQWLPWFILALVGTTAIFVLLRVGVRLALPARPVSPAAGGAGQASAGSSPSAAGGASVGGSRAGAPSPAGSVAASASLQEADRKLNEKINQTLKK